MKTHMKVITLLAGCMLTGKLLFAQDPRFGQYFTSPMTLNPALTGKGVNDWRVLTNYRSQWQGEGTQPFTTAMLSLEKNLSVGTDKNTLGIGAMFLSDASNGGILKNNYFSIGLSYNNALDAEAKHFLGGGLTLAYANRILDPSKFQFGSQLGSDGYQPSLPANDGVTVPKKSYLDVNAGISYSYHGERSGFYTGVSYFHAARPKDAAMSGSAYTIDPRLSLQMGYRLATGDMGNELGISSLWEKQGEYKRFTAGLLYKLVLTGSALQIRSLNFGIWDRVGDAVYPYLGIEANDWLLGFSYDVITSKIATTSLQSFEISFGWQFGSARSAAVKKHPVIWY